MSRDDENPPAAEAAARPEIQGNLLRHGWPFDCASLDYARDKQGRHRYAEISRDDEKPARC
jgi:hypothetical protein